MRKWGLILIVALAAVCLVAASGIAKKSSRDHGWLGVYTHSVNYDVAKAYDLDTKYGAVIADVIGDSPADKAGLKDGDVIISLNDEKVTDADDLTDLIAETKPGDRVRLGIIRDGKDQTIEVTLAEPDEESSIWTDKDWAKDKKVKEMYRLKTKKQPYIGVMLDNLSDQLGDYFGIKDGEGALITEVVEDAPAQKAGLAAGDVIVKVDNEPVEDAGDVSDLIEGHKTGDQVTVTVMRDHREKNITVEVGETDSPRFGGYQFFQAPDMAAITVPKLRGLHYGNFDENDFDIDFDNEEFAEQMKQLARELKNMKLEFKSDVTVDKDELKAEMEQLKKELQEMKQELKRELENMKNDRD